MTKMIDISLKIEEHSIAGYSITIKKQKWIQKSVECLYDKDDVRISVMQHFEIRPYSHKIYLKGRDDCAEPRQTVADIGQLAWFLACISLVCNVTIVSSPNKFILRRL